MVDVSQKRCFKCGQVKPMDDFYRHPATADGRLGKCKECAKADTISNTRLRREYYSNYNHERNKRPERIAKRKEYRKQQYQKHAEKHAARRMINVGVRDGKIDKPDRCENCGATGRIEGHHQDYSRPLDVQWLCFVCHREKGHGQTVTRRNAFN